MKKHELLVPVGNMECLYQAVYNGADAVYLACKNFGARKYARNFDNEEIVKAIKFCHLYGVKIFVTMNTLVKDNEVENFLKQALFLHKNGVDALIVQDFGMICLLRKKYPNLEIHASTQANISQKETCELYEKLGVKRVVFARELSIDEIDKIEINIEKEAFIHGALCISYSGCCLMSSMLGGRSGNRGECAGCCRLPYSLIKDNKTIIDNKYLLSTKELNETKNIDRLLNSSIYSFKIEGRMKSPLYVGFITRLYRNLIDKKEINILKEEEKLKTIFNREFTKGRLFNENDIDLMNINNPNHVGLVIGKTIEITKKYIKIEINKNEEINQYDAIRFQNSNKGFVINYLYDENKKLTKSCKNICYVDNKIGLESNDIVSKTQDYNLNKEYENPKPKKIPISIKVNAKIEQGITVEITDSINTIQKNKKEVFKSINSPITKENIIKHLKKLNDTPFYCDDITIDIEDNIFIQVKTLNDIRRELIEKLIEIRQNKKKEIIEKDIVFENRVKDQEAKEKISCLVRTEEQLKTCLELNVDRIYIEDYYLYEQYKNEQVYLIATRCSRKNELREKNIVSDYLNYKIPVIGSYPLNVTNIYTAYYLKDLNIKVIPLSVELTNNEKYNLIKKYEEKFGSATFEILNYEKLKI